MNKKFTEKNIYKELTQLEQLEQEIKMWRDEVDGLINSSEKNLGSITQTFETLHFLLWGSFLAIGLNLLTNILHDLLKPYGYSYYILVLSIILLSIIKVLEFVVKKWNTIKNNDALIGSFSKDDDYPKDYKEKVVYFKNKLGDLKKRVSN